MSEILRKIVVIRPGALGDVLVARGLLSFLKNAFPGVQLVLVAPGERGRLLVREGWADLAYDWEDRVFSWLFLRRDGRVAAEAIPALLREVFDHALLVFSFTGSGLDERGRIIGDNLRGLVKTGAVWCGAGFPESVSKSGGVVRWLTEIGAEVCVSGGLRRCPELPNVTDCIRRRWRVEPGTFRVPFGGGGYLLIHPGSGSSRKNWPLAHYAELARGLMSSGVKGIGSSGASGFFSGLALLSGEADGHLADELRDMIGAGEVFRDLSLHELSILLSRAYLYVGNDSGVSHLSCAVSDVSGLCPRSVVLFGPSAAEIWGEPAALRFRCGLDFSFLPVSRVLSTISRFLSLSFTGPELS